MHMIIREGVQANGAAYAENMAGPEAQASFFDDVSLGLTDNGSSVLRAHCSSLEQEYGFNQQFARTDDNRVVMPLAVAMNIFGPLMRRGQPKLLVPRINLVQPPETPTELSIDLDSLVRVQVTYWGKKVWDRKHSQALGILTGGKTIHPKNNPYRLQRDKQGYSTVKLERLFYIFGYALGTSPYPILRPYFMYKPLPNASDVAGRPVISSPDL